MTTSTSEDLLKLTPVNPYSTDPDDAEDPALRRIKSDLGVFGEVTKVEGLISTTQTHGVVLDGVQAVLRNDTFTRDIRIDVTQSQGGGISYANHGIAAPVELAPVNPYEGAAPTRFQDVTEKAFERWDSHSGAVAAREARGKIPHGDPLTVRKVLLGILDIFLAIGAMFVYGFAVRSTIAMMDDVFSLGERTSERAIAVLSLLGALVITVFIIGKVVDLMVSSIETAADDATENMSEFDQRFVEKKRKREEFDRDLEKIFREGFDNPSELSVFLEGLLTMGASYGLHDMQSFSLTSTDQLVGEGGEGSVRSGSRIFTRPCVTFSARKASRKDASVSYVFTGTHIFRHDPDPLFPAGVIQLP